MKKKIIFIQSFKFLDFHYKLYELNNLKKYFDVECYDLTLIRNKRIDFHYRYLKNKSKIKKFDSFTNYKNQILNELKDYDKKLIICFLHFPSTFSELFVYYLLIKKGANICIFDFNNFFPLDVNKNLKFKDLIVYKMTRLITRPKQAINHRKIFLVNFITSKLAKYIYPKYIFVNSKSYYSEHKKRWKKTKVYRLHSWDGSNFLSLKKKSYKRTKNSATYLSAFSLNSASDSANYNTSRLESSKIILKNLDNFFDNFEKKFNLTVQIAKHPREEDSSNSPIYKKNKRLASKYLTGELISNSKLVITTMSSAVSYAALLKKPILFVISNEHYKNISLISSTKKMSKYFNSDLINIDLKKDYKIHLKINNLTRKRYNLLIKDYLISEKYKNKYNYEVLISLLK